MACKGAILVLLRTREGPQREGRCLEEVRQVSEEGLNLLDGVNSQFSYDYMSSERGPPLVTSSLYR